MRKSLFQHKNRRVGKCKEKVQEEMHKGYKNVP
jgi:hypothetical protein